MLFFIFKELVANGETYPITILRGRLCFNGPPRGIFPNGRRQIFLQKLILFSINLTERIAVEIKTLLYLALIANQLSYRL